MLSAVALCVAGLVYVALAPGAPAAPNATWAALRSVHAETGQEPIANWQMRLGQTLAESGVKVAPSVFALLVLAGAAGVAVAVSTVLGPFSGVFSGIAVAMLVRENLVARRQAKEQKFAGQFREALFAITACLRAGQSLPSALETTYRDLARLLGADEEPILIELRHITAEIRLGTPVHVALTNFKQRVPLEEVAQFVDALSIARQLGGNLAEVMSEVAALIGDKLAVRQEVQVLTAEKRAEGGLISILPIGVLLMNMFINPHYMEPLTTTWMGQALVGSGFFMIICSYLVSQAVVRIEV